MARTYKTGVLITGDSKGAVQAVNLTEKEVDKLNSTTKLSKAVHSDAAKSIVSGFGSMAKQAAAWGAAAAAAGTAVTVALVKSGLQTVDTLAKTSDKLGIATESLAAYRFAAEQTGVSQEKADVALQRFTRRLSDAAAGTGPAVSAFEALGLSAEELIQLKPDEAFARVADKMNQVENSSQKVSLAFKLFDSEGVGLVNTLALGSDGLDRMREEAEVLGLTLSRVDAAKVEQANDAMNRIGKAVSGLGQQLAVKFAPMLQAIADYIFDVTKETGGMGNVASKVFNAMQKAVGVVANAMRGLQATWYGLVGIANDAGAAVLESLDSLVAGAYELWNKLPWVDEIEYQSALGRWADAMRENAQEGWTNFANLVNQPLPSDAIEELTLEYERQSSAQAAAMIAAQDVIQGEIIETADVTESLATKTEKSAKDVQSAWDKAIEGTINRIDESFASAWKGAFDSFGDFADSLKASFESLIAELAHMAITRPIVMQIGAAFGLGGAASAASAAGSAGSLLSGISSAGGIMNWLGGGVGGALGGIGGLYQSVGSGLGSLASMVGPNTWLGNTLGNAGLSATSTGLGYSYGSTLSGVGNLGLNLGAGIAGNYLGGAVFDQSRYSNVGGTVGGAIGSIWGPVGTVVGSFLGNGIGSLFGRQDPDLTRSTVNFNSGEYIRRDNRGHDFDSAASDVGSYLITLGQMLGASGVLDYSIHGQDGYRLGTGADRRTFGQDMDAFLDAALEEMLRSATALDPVIRDLVRGFDGAAEETLQFTAAILSINDQAGINTVTQAISDFNAQTYTAYESYQLHTVGLGGLINSFDGSLSATQNLNAVLAENKAAAYQMAVAIQAIGASITEQFDASAEYFRNSVLTEDELFQKRRDERREVQELLETATDPDEIARLAARWDELNRLIFDSLDPELQNLRAEDFAQASEFIAGLSNRRLDDALDALQTTQDNINDMITDMLEQQAENTRLDNESATLLNDAVRYLVDNGVSVQLTQPAINA